MCTPSFRQSATRHRRHTRNAATRNRVSEAPAIAVVRMVVRTKLSNVGTLAFDQGFSARKYPRLDTVLALVPRPIPYRTLRPFGAGGFALRRLHGGDTLATVFSEMCLARARRARICSILQRQQERSEAYNSTRAPCLLHGPRTRLLGSTAFMAVLPTRAQRPRAARHAQRAAAPAVDRGLL
jgi:hypothetical protein